MERCLTIYFWIALNLVNRMADERKISHSITAAILYFEKKNVKIIKTLNIFLCSYVIASDFLGEMLNYICCWKA